MESERRGQNEERPEQDRLESFFPDYHHVVMRQCSHMVSTVMARHIERELDRWPRPRWIRFVDITGARFRVRADAIQGLNSRPGNRASCGGGSATSGIARIRPSRFRFDRAGEAGVGTRVVFPLTPAGSGTYDGKEVS